MRSSKAGRRPRRSSLASSSLDWSRTLEDLERHFDLFQSENARLLWMPLAGLQVVTGRDPRPVIDAAVEFLSDPAGSGRPGRDDPDAACWREFRARWEEGREVTLRWLDEFRRNTLRAEKVPDDLVEPVLDDPLLRS